MVKGYSASTSGMIFDNLTACICQLSSTVSEFKNKHWSTNHSEVILEFVFSCDIVHFVHNGPVKKPASPCPEELSIHFKAAKWIQWGVLDYRSMRNLESL